MHRVRLERQDVNLMYSGKVLLSVTDLPDRTATGTAEVGQN